MDVKKKCTRDASVSILFLGSRTVMQARGCRKQCMVKLKLRPGSVYMAFNFNMVWY